MTTSSRNDTLGSGFAQIATLITIPVATGTIATAARPPAAKDLADSLGVNVHTVLRACQELRDEGQGELKAATEGRAVDRRHDRGAHRVERPCDRQVQGWFEQRLAAVELGEVSAAAEGPAGAGQHDGGDGRVVFDLFERGQQVGAQAWFRQLTGWLSIRTTAVEPCRSTRTVLRGEVIGPLLVWSASRRAGGRNTAVDADLGQQRAVVVPHLDVVDPGPSVEDTLRGVRGELDAYASGTQEGDVRVHGHARPAMAVQGEREGRVREREHVAAVHDAMAVSHARRRRHPSRRGPERAQTPRS
jgi:DNA-binding transcriptional regulator YhcF (GntR family)